MAALALAAPAAFSVVFGEEWREAGVYAQLLAPWLYFVFVSAPLSNLFDVLEQQPWELAFNVVMMAARAAALWVGGALGGPLGAVGLFGAVSAVLWLGHTVWMLHWGEAALGEAARAVGRHACSQPVRSRSCSRASCGWRARSRSSPCSPSPHSAGSG